MTSTKRGIKSGMKSKKGYRLGGSEKLRKSHAERDSKREEEQETYNENHSEKKKEK